MENLSYFIKGALIELHLNIYKYLLLVAMIALFMPAFALPIAINNFCITVYFILMIICTLYCLIFNFKYFNKSFTALLSFRATKFLFLYFGWLIFISLAHALLGNSSLIKSFLSVFVRFINVFLPFLLGFIFVKYFKNQKTFKFLYIFVWGIMLWGIFNFIAFYFDIEIFKSIFNFFVNKRLFMKNLSELEVMIGDFPRIHSVFEEPSYLAAFIGAFLPFIYKISFSNLKITANKILNKILKILMPLVAWGLIIGTFSPIYLILNIIITYIYILVENGIKIKFSFKTTCLFFFALVLMYCFYCYFISIDTTNNVLLRIQAVLKTFSDINLLIMAEQSLGRRLIDIINEFIIFLNNPLLGVGPSNLGTSVFKQIQNSPVILTPEIEMAMLKGKDTYLSTPNIFFNYLPESGLIGIVLLYGFFISVFNLINKILRYTKNNMYNFAYSLKYFVLIYIIFSFYDSQLWFPYGLVVFGITLGFVYNIKKDLRGNNENINS